MAGRAMRFVESDRYSPGTGRDSHRDSGHQGLGKLLAERLSKDYSVRIADLVTDRHHILRLWRFITSPTAPDSRKLDWFYILNPAGPGTIYLLWHDPTDTAVGIACAGRRDILIDRSIVRGAVCGDLVIDPAHRAIGPALRFRKFVLDHLKDQFDLFYAFPNERVVKAIAVAGPNFEHELFSMVLPLRITDYLQRYIPKALASVLGAPAQLLLDLILRGRAPSSEYVGTTPDDSFFDTLWEGISANPGSMGVRDSSFLKWRLQQHPSAAFSLFAVTCSHGSPAGYIAYEIDSDLRVRIVDVLSRDDAAFEACTRMFVYEMRKSGVLSVSVRKATEPTVRLRLLKRLGFVISERSKGFVFGNGDVCQNLAKELLYLNAVDSDV
jgi:hypothetical protein